MSLIQEATPQRIITDPDTDLALAPRSFCRPISSHNVSHYRVED